MSADREATGGDAEQSAATGDRAAELEVLREENQRLRDAYRRTKQVQYRRTALGLAATGLAALAGAALLPSVRDVLLVLAAIGVFSGVLTVSLTPERVLTASVTNAVYSTHADTATAVVDELGLQDDHVYVPTATGVRLFRPQHADYDLPEDPSSLFLADDDATRGVAFEPVGDPLYRDLEATAVASDTPDVDAVVGTAADAVVEQFELATSAAYDRQAGQVTVTLADVEPAGVDRFDHPAVSLFAVVLARELNAPVTLAATTPADHQFTLTWPAS